MLPRIFHRGLDPDDPLADGWRPARLVAAERGRCSDAADTRWALPDRIAISKLADYAWQEEFRLVFSLTDALAFENVALALTPHDAAPPTPTQEHAFYDAAVGSLGDLCHMHTGPP